MAPILSMKSALNLPAAVGSATPSGFTPTQIRTEYGVNSISFPGVVSADGTGQTIGIVDAGLDKNIIADLAAFDAFFGLPSANLTIWDQNGNAVNPVTSTIPDQGWGVEICLDVEWAHVIAPGAAIRLYAANTAFASDLNAAVLKAAQQGCQVVSMSFGGPEFPGEAAAEDSFFSSTPGVTFLAATGDDYGNGGYPAFSKYVVAVGGTTINGTPSTGYVSESQWHDTATQGSAGGISQFVARPSYQSTVNTGSTLFRTIPDVAMLAEPSVPIYDSLDYQASGAGTGSWFPGTIGGTSLSSPMFAALVAIADQLRAKIGLTSLDGITQTLPALYSFAGTSNFHVIATSNNYDTRTGLGTPVANILVPALADYPSFLIAQGTNLNLTYTSPTTFTVTVDGASYPTATTSTIQFTGTSANSSVTINDPFTVMTAVMSANSAQVNFNNGAVQGTFTVAGGTISLNGNNVAGDTVSFTTTGGTSEFAASPTLADIQPLTGSAFFDSVTGFATINATDTGTAQTDQALFYVYDAQAVTASPSFVKVNYGSSTVTASNYPIAFISAGVDASNNHYTGTVTFNSNPSAKNSFTFLQQPNGTAGSSASMTGLSNVTSKTYTNTLTGTTDLANIVAVALFATDDATLTDNLGSSQLILAAATATINTAVKNQPTRSISVQGFATVTGWGAGLGDSELAAGTPSYTYVANPATVNYWPVPAVSGPDTLGIQGTGGADSIAVVLPMATTNNNFYVTYNGTLQTAPLATIKRIIYTNPSSNGQAIISGVSGGATVTMAPNLLKVVANGYEVDINNASTLYYYGNTNDVVTVTDTSGTGTYIIGTGYTNLRGNGFLLNAAGSNSIQGFASGAGSVAILYPGANTVISAATQTYFVGGSATYLVQNFHAVYAYGSGAGTAYLYSTTGGSTFVSTKDYSYITGTGFFNQAAGFSTVYAIAHDATDRAYFYAPAGSTFTSTPTTAWVTGAGYLSEALGFGVITAQSQSTANAAYMYDSSGNDTLAASGSSATLQTSTSLVTVMGFGNVTATRTKGSDYQYRAQINYTLNVVGGWKFNPAG